MLYDQQSTNGVFVNDKRLEPEEGKSQGEVFFFFNFFLCTQKRKKSKSSPT